MSDQGDYVRIMALAEAIAKLERKVDFILKELKLDYKDDEAAIPPQLAEVYALIRQGKKMEAIQAYRKQNGTGLNEAKAAVEAIEAKLMLK